MLAILSNLTSQISEDICALCVDARKIEYQLRLKTNFKKKNKSFGKLFWLLKKGVISVYDKAHCLSRSYLAILTILRIKNRSRLSDNGRELVPWNVVTFKKLYDRKKERSHRVLVIVINESWISLFCVLKVF